MHNFLNDLNNYMLLCPSLNYMDWAKSLSTLKRILNSFGFVPQYQCTVIEHTCTSYCEVPESYFISGL